MTRTTEAQAQGRTPRPDGELLAAVRAQRPDAFQDLRDRHWPTAVAVARFHTPTRQDAEQLAGTSFDQLLAEVGGEDSSEDGSGVFLRARLVAVVGRAGPETERAAERISGIFVGLPASWQAVLWHLEVEGLELDRTAAVLGLSPAATTALHLQARAGLRTAYRQARLDLPTIPGCADCAADLGAFADGGLTAERAQAVQSHLGACPRCTADHLYLQDTGRGLRSWLLPVLAGVPLWDSRTDELVELVRAAGRTSAAHLSAAPGTDVAGGALAAVLVSRRGRKVLLGAGALAAAAALAGVAVTGSGGLGEETTQATSRGSGSGVAQPAASPPAASSDASGTSEDGVPDDGSSDDGASVARGVGAAAPGGAGEALSLPTREPSPGPLTESAAEARRAQTQSGTIGTAGTADGSATQDREAGAHSDSAADSPTGAVPRPEENGSDDRVAPRPAVSRGESSAAESSGGGTTVARDGDAAAAPSSGGSGPRTGDSVDKDEGVPEVPAEERVVPGLPAGESVAPAIPTGESAAPAVPVEVTPAPGTAAPAAEVDGASDPDSAE